MHRGSIAVPSAARARPVSAAVPLWLTAVVVGVVSLALSPRAQAACNGGAPNGVGNTGEQCDDGNTVDTDGCTNACVTQAGFECSCPAGQLTGVTVDDPQTLLAIVGGTGGGAFADRCPAGQVTIGFDYTIGTFSGPYEWVTRSSARCASLSISGTTVTITPAGATPMRGADGGTAHTLTCPAGQVVAGYRGNSRTDGGFTGIAGVQLYCASLVVGADGRVQAGEAVEGPVATATGGTIVSVGPSLCPAGQVVSGNQGRSGSIIDQFTMLCQELYTNCAAATACASVCGDGLKVAGEGCDDGNASSFDGCSSACRVEAGFACATPGAACSAPCGDAILTAGETCDDGGNHGGDGCSASCQVEEGYTCVGTATELVTNGGFAAGNTGFTSAYGYDAGANSAEGNYTVSNQGSAFHESIPGNWTDQGGDGFSAFFNGTAGLTVYETNVPVVAGRTYVFVAYAASWYPAEPAVLSFTMNGTPVTAPVTLPTEVNAWVRVSGAYAATSTGTVPVRIVNGQAAVGGNDFAIDSISVKEATLTRCSTVCGDGLRAGPESCDDGNPDADDGCSASCRTEAGWVCSGAPSTCAAARCGDGITAGAETCDDGSEESLDGCSPSCQVETAWACSGSPSTCGAARCGDGITAGSETCDDVNPNPGDGCNLSCQVEAGWGCSGSPSTCQADCGDGLRVGAEACDDGSDSPNDGCSDACAVQEGFTCTGDLGSISTCVANEVPDAGTPDAGTPDAGTPDEGSPDAGTDPGPVASGCGCGTGSPLGFFAFGPLVLSAMRRRRGARV